MTRRSIGTVVAGVAVALSAVLLTPATAAEAADENGTVQFRPADLPQSEPESATHIVFVGRAGGTQGAVGATVSSTDGGTATGGSSCAPGVDFVHTTATVAWADGASGYTYAVFTVCQDAVVEADETIEFILTDPTGGATLGTPANTLYTIENDDTAASGTVQFRPADLPQSEPETATHIVFVGRAGGTQGAVGATVSSTDGGTATGGSSCTPGVDFVHTTATVAWADGASGYTYAVFTVCQDAVVEADETIEFILTDPTGGATLGTPANTLYTIENDDTAASGTVQFRPADLPQSEPETATHIVFVGRAGGTQGAVGATVSSTDGGTATGGSSCAPGVDFVHTTATVAWADGASGYTYAVFTVCQDAVVEADETIEFILTDPTGGATLGTPAITLYTIEDDDDDGTGPVATLDSGPAPVTTDNSPTFVFSGPPGVTFECALAIAVEFLAYGECSSPLAWPAFPDDTYIFSVHAIDSLGRVGPDARLTFRIDTTGPGTTISQAPPSTSADNTPTFAFSSEPGAPFECSLSTGADAFGPCSSPLTYPAQADGSYTFKVRALDELGNPGVAAEHGFSIATTPTNACATATRVVTGTNANNTISGGRLADRILGLGGNDTIEGRTNNDCLIGGTGNDQLGGGVGNDELLGDDGADTLALGGGVDIASGGAGNDRITSRDGVADRVDCGAGTADIATVDNLDVVVNCESVRRG